MHRISNTRSLFHFKRSSAMWLLLVLLTLPHMNPAYLNQLPLWGSLLNVLRMVSFVIILFWILVFKRKISIVSILIGAWEIYIFMNTWVHGGEVYEATAPAFSVLSVVLLYDAAYELGEVFLSAQLFCFEVVIYINLLTIILFPDGLYSADNHLFMQYANWFLGYYNNFTKYFIPALMFAWLYMRQRGKRLRALAMTVATVLSGFLVWSGGVIVTLCVMVLVFLFFKNRTSIFNYFNYWLLHIVFLLSVFVFRLQELFYWIIGGILLKWSSLSSRIFIWEQTLDLVYDSPLFGYGIQSPFQRAAEVHRYDGIHAHSMFFEILYQGGTIGLCLWIVIVIIAGRYLYKNRHNIDGKIISTAFLGWCVATLVEPFTSSFLMGMFVIAYRYGSSKSFMPGAAIPMIKEKHKKAHPPLGRVRKHIGAPQ